MTIVASSIHEPGLRVSLTIMIDFVQNKEIPYHN